VNKEWGLLGCSRPYRILRNTEFLDIKLKWLISTLEFLKIKHKILGVLDGIKNQD
jgi:hypothetical protein